jgi:hypothetical protein
MPELETLLRIYAAHLDERYPDVSPDEIIGPDQVVWPSPDRRRRRGWVVALAAALVVIGLAGVAVVDRYVGDDAASESDLGVFEPIRGMVVFTVGRNSTPTLVAVDPSNPETQYTVEVHWPDPPSLPGAVPAGWSADGSTLALVDELNSDLFLMDQSGAVTRIPTDRIRGFRMGCCYFVTSAWLSPDGSAMLGDGGPSALILADLDDIGVTRTFRLDLSEFPGDPEFSNVASPVWSPDGSEVAFVVYKVPAQGGSWEPTVQIIDLDSGARRELVGPEFGHIRNLAWSPDGSQLLLVTGDWLPPNPILNPLANVHPTDVYLVDTETSDRRRIASGYYVAASWAPDGTQIALVDYPGAKHEVVVMNADGSDRRVIADLGPNLFTGLAWHPVAPTE